MNDFDYGRLPAFKVAGGTCLSLTFCFRAAQTGLELMVEGEVESLDKAADGIIPFTPSPS